MSADEGFSDKRPKSSRPSAGGSFIHKDHLEWLVKDFANDDRVAWIFEEQNQPLLRRGGIVLLCAYLIIGPGAQLISNLVGFLYPAYCSIRALESPNTADDTRWLTYWVVFSTFALIDTFSGFLLSWIPFYWLGKVLFLCWCFSPSDFNGSDVIYKHVILPFFKKHEKKISKHMGNVESLVNKASEQAEKIVETERVAL